MTIGLSSSHRPSSRGRLVSRLTAGAVVLVAVGVGSSALASDATSDPLTFTGCLGRIGVIYNVSTNPVETLVPVQAGTWSAWPLARVEHRAAGSPRASRAAERVGTPS